MGINCRDNSCLLTICYLSRQTYVPIVTLMHTGNDIYIGVYVGKGFSHSIIEVRWSTQLEVIGQLEVSGQLEETASSE